jgi:hypothetical protein
MTMRPPSLVIVLELDAPPRVYVDALSEQDEQQLQAWLDATLPDQAREGLRALGVAA